MFEQELTLLEIVTFLILTALIRLGTGMVISTALSSTKLSYAAICWLESWRQETFTFPGYKIRSNISL